MTRRPTTLKVGLYTYRIKWVRRKAYDRENFAYCDSNNLILFLPSMQTKERIREFFFHELTHALFHHYQLGDDADEETIASCLGRGIAALFKDNPWLAAWL